MHAFLATVGIVVLALSVGCSQPISPTSPTFVADGAFIDSPDGNANSLEIPAAVVADSARQTVPFKGSLEGVVTVTFPDPASLSVFIKGTGTAAQLGRYTVQIPHTVDLATGTGTGSLVFTTANGDTLTAEFTGLGTPTATPNVVLIVETAVITGGTGRFAGATGNFKVERLFDFATNLTTGSFEGTISSAGSRTH